MLALTPGLLRFDACERPPAIPDRRFDPAFGLMFLPGFSAVPYGGGGHVVD
jgi:hypothetical protein